MSRKLSDTRLEVLHAHGVAKRKHPDPMNRFVDIDARELCCLIDELKRRRTPGGQKGGFVRSPLTEQLIKMQVGDVIEVPAVTNGAITTNRNTARKVLENPDARWRAVHLENGITRIERRPDGEPYHYGKSKNLAIELLAKTQVGDTVVFEGKVYNGIKIQARRLMGNPEAQWRTTTLVNGKTKAERVA